MKMITHCPACGTAFRIYPEQLAAREGHVRCGQCAIVFDARMALFSEPVPPAPSVEEPSLNLAPERPRVEVPKLKSRRVPSPPTESQVSETSVESDFAFSLEASQSRRAAMLWMLGAIVMVVLLSAQLAFVYRGELATFVPMTRPALNGVCRALRCTIPLPSYANFISIESSELAAERGANGVFTLAAVIRNRATFAQAHPALELTLTDAEDRPLARRILQPKDYLDDRSARDSGFAANSEYNFRVHIDAGGLGASGYRLYAFYE